MMFLYHQSIYSFFCWLFCPLNRFWEAKICREHAIGIQKKYRRNQTEREMPWSCSHNSTNILAWWYIYCIRLTCNLIANLRKAPPECEFRRIWASSLVIHEQFMVLLNWHKIHDSCTRIWVPAKLGTLVPPWPRNPWIRRGFVWI